MTHEILTIGSCTLDCIINIKDILRFELLEEENVKKYTAIEYSKKLNVENLRFIPGGSAANIAADCAMVNLKSAYIGMIGKDFSAKMCLADLGSRGVDIDHINQTDEDKTAFSVILKSGWGKDRSILAYKGANDLITPSDIDEDLFKNVKAFAWTSLTRENSCKAIEKCIDLTNKYGGKVYAAPSMSIIKNSPKWVHKLIGKSDVLSLNYEEATALTGKKNNASILKDLFRKDLEKISITDGSDGSIISDGKTIINSGVYKVSIKDTTGSGDAFMSGIITSDLKNYSLEKSSKFASAFGAFEAMEIGVREGIPNNFDEIDKFIEENELDQVISELK
ncbi:MAG: hypothetical protein GF317_19135 [Candidatus Lokiarchaeota archaeon]|nr:hypothetical protein [Candidatus Lokiarchaeota archaeon]MBD3201627.1 hypothetical protein [Candidatus Lokiarchaeota archaeon]